MHYSDELQYFLFQTISELNSKSFKTHYVSLSVVTFNHISPQAI